jgi:multiple sugar transport system substrate-binding protein
MVHNFFNVRRRCASFSKIGEAANPLVLRRLHPHLEEKMTRTNSSRRDFLKRASMLAAGSFLVACAPQAATQPAAEGGDTAEAPKEAPPQSSGGGVVSYWVAWPESTYGEIWKVLEAKEEFKALVGDTKVELKPNVAEEALLTAIAGGTPPDGASNFNYTDYMIRGVLAPLDTYINASTKVKKEDFLESVWEVGVYEGKNYGLPANECFVQLGFCYNAKLVQEAGLDPEKAPETWDDLYAWHEKITKFDDSGNVKVIGYNPTDFMAQTIWGSSAWDVSTSWGFEWYDEAGKKFNLNNESMVDYFNTSKKFVDLVGIDKLTAFSAVEGQGGWGPAYYSGVLATMLDGYWEPGELSGVSEEIHANNRASWLPVPAARKGTKAQGAGGHIVMVLKDAKNNEMMYKISEWLTEPVACDAIFKAMGWLPARKTFLSSVDPKTYNGLEFFLKSAEEATYWGETVKCPITTFVGVTYPQIREQVYRGEFTPEQGAEELQKRCEEELKNQGFA